VQRQGSVLLLTMCRTNASCLLMSAQVMGGYDLLGGGNILVGFQALTGDPVFHLGREGNVHQRCETRTNTCHSPLTHMPLSALSRPLLAVSLPYWPVLVPATLCGARRPLVLHPCSPKTPCSVLISLLTHSLLLLITRCAQTISCTSTPTLTRRTSWGG
jgi:hypothetical protein